MKEQQKIRVCNGRSCNLFGSERIMATLENEYKLSAGESSATIDLNYCDCRGYCSSGPNVDIDSELIFMAESDTVLGEINAINSENSKEKKVMNIIIQDDFLGDI